MATVGEALTLMIVVIVFVPEQPAALAPIIEYVVVAVGLTLKLVPVAPLFTKVQVVAPLGVIKLLLPEQILALETLPIATVGDALTDTLVIAVFVQPLVEVPVTV